MDESQQSCRVISCRVEPTGPLVCGEVITCTLLMSVEEQIAPGGRIRIHFTQSPYYRMPPAYGLPVKGFVFYPRAEFQTHDPQGPGYLTAVASSGTPVEIELEPNRCFFTLLCPQGLGAGDALTITIGDSSGGGPGVRVAHHPTYGDAGPVRDWQLVCDVDRQGDGQVVRQAHMPRLRVVPAPPSQVLVRIKSQARPGVSTDLQITVVDRFGNHVPDYRGSFRASVEGASGTLTVDPSAMLGKGLALEPEDGGSKRFPDSMVLQEEGIHRIRVESVSPGGDALQGVSNPVTCGNKTDDYEILWGDIHGHSYYSDGTHSPDFYYDYARTVGYLDFCALTDHDGFADHLWPDIIDATARAYEPGAFTTFLGYEWKGDLLQQIVVLFKNALGGYYPGRSATSRSPIDFLALVAKDGAMVMRHDMPSLGTRWRRLDASGELERLVQIYSFMLASEAVDAPHVRGELDGGNSVQAALADGLRFGFIGCSDTHASMPGRCQSVTKGFPGYGSRPYGLTAVYARENTREEVFRALYDRRCYAATDRILVDFRVNGRCMGQEMSLAGPRLIEARVAGTAPLVHVALIKNNQVIHSTGQGATEAAFEYRDEVEIARGDYYYLRVLQEDGGMAWASPIWIDPV